MAPHKTITINGRKYDAVTGLPLAPESAPAPKPAPTEINTPKPKSAAPKVPRPASTPRPDIAKSSSAVHSSVQRSQTLNRRAAKKPAVPNKPITRRPTVGRQMDVAKSTDVSRFAKHPAPVAPVAKPAASATPDKPAQSHPVAQRALERTAPKKAVVAAKKPTTAREVKDTAIAKALAAPKQAPVKADKAPKKGLRTLIIVGSIIVVILLGLFAAYKFIPTISVSIASAQAGIQATYPEFTPDGYSLSQPVNFSDGEVDLKFTSNSDDNYYSITQTRSSWDSSAVLDNVVTPAAGADYVTTKERGLTIYTYESAAVWVNGGILYKIDSKAPLSGDQIRRIATSL